MKVLYVAPFVPWVCRVRTYNLIVELSRFHDIGLVCLTTRSESAYLDQIRPYCKFVTAVPHSRWHSAFSAVTHVPTTVPLRLAYSRSRQMKAAVERATSKFGPEVIYVDRWRALQYTSGVRTQIPTVCDPTDSMLLYHQRLMRSGKWWERLLAIEEAMKFSRAEPALANQVDAVVFCSAHDRDAVRSRAKKDNFFVVPNGVDCKKFYFKNNEEEEGNRVLFVGSFDYPPNIHAAEYLVREILPRVRSRIPSVRFALVGLNAKKRLDRFAARVAGLEIHDFVPDVRTHIAQASVAVAPITFGAGVTNKVLEAFATGTAVVATPFACGDLPVINGKELIIAEGAQPFADAVIWLAEDRNMRRKMADDARRLVESQFSLERVAEAANRVVLSVAAQRNARPESLIGK